jgi:hypothetical protein
VVEQPGPWPLAAGDFLFSDVLREPIARIRAACPVASALVDAPLIDFRSVDAFETNGATLLKSEEMARDGVITDNATLLSH